MTKRNNDTTPNIDDRTANELPAPSGEWRNDSVLRELYVRRGWSAKNIATYFDVEGATVRQYISSNDEVVTADTGGNQPPSSGLAGKLWRASIVEKREAAHGE